MLTDLRLSVRALAKARGFAVIAILTLGVGIGASTAIFSALHALVLSPFNYPRQEQIAHVWSGHGWPLSNADFPDLHDQSRSFTAFGAYQRSSINVGQENAQAIEGVSGTNEVLRVFGISPALGRLFAPADDVPGAPPVVILSHGLWQQLLGGDPQAIGRTLRINGRDTTVVGIMPAGYEFVSPWSRRTDVQLWLPLALAERKPDRGSHYLLGVARLREDATVASADAEIKAIGRRLTAMYPDTNTRKEFLVRSLHYEITRDVRGQVWLLFGSVVLVLMIACGNVASMLLARGARRHGEFGVRVALGASPGRLVRLALAESLVLAGAGATLGIGIALAGLEVLRAAAPVSMARKAAMTMDVSALGFAIGAALLTAILTGLPPALAATRTSIAGILRADARGAVGSRSRQRTLRSLIIAQVAVAFVLANGAVLFSTSYLKLREDSRVLDTESVVAVTLGLRGPRYKEEPARLQFWQSVVERLQALPGVTKVGITSKLPLEGGSNTSGLVNDETYDPTQKRLLIERSSVTDDYFEAMGLRLIKGRNLRPEDRVGDIRGVVVNQELVRKAWPNKDPLGEIIRANQPEKPWYVVRVVGVVEDVKQWGADEPVQPEMFTAPEGHWGTTIQIILRTTVPRSTLAPLLRREVAALDPELAIKEIRTMREVVNTATHGDRVVAGLVNFFTLTALGLVAVGLYGTLSYSVQQRTREIGVRVAVGAVKHDILALVVGQGGRWVGIGLAAGLVGSVALASALKSLVYRMEGLTAPPLLLAGLAVGLAGLVACWSPAHRAAQLDPLQALRAD
jgi:putative ABC transport system permease protein